MTTNKYRGEAKIHVGGKPYTLAFTFGALGRLATAFPPPTIDAKITWDDVRKLLLVGAVEDIPKIIACFMAGNGHPEPTAAELETLEVWEYFDVLIPGLFDREKGDKTDEAPGKARPPKR